MTMTHSKAWKLRPSTEEIFVSKYVHHTFPILKMNPKICKVLDVACGNGMGVTLPLLRRGYEVASFDHTDSGVKAVKQNTKAEGLKVKVKKADMYRRFLYNDNSFDATFCFQAIYHGRLEQIMAALSEISRVTKKAGWFFATFLSYDEVGFDKSKRKHYIKVKPKDREVLRSYLRQDKAEPHLFYFLSKDWEYNVPHYFMAKDELKVILSMYFEEVRIKAVSDNKYSLFWLVSCRV